MILGDSLDSQAILLMEFHANPYESSQILCNDRVTLPLSKYV